MFDGGGEERGREISGIWQLMTEKVVRGRRYESGGCVLVNVAVGDGGVEVVLVEVVPLACCGDGEQVPGCSWLGCQFMTLRISTPCICSSRDKRTALRFVNSVRRRKTEIGENVRERQTTKSAEIGEFTFS